MILFEIEGGTPLEATEKRNIEVNVARVSIAMRMSLSQNPDISLNYLS
jgi:hypothetical protein